MNMGIRGASEPPKTKESRTRHFFPTLQIQVSIVHGYSSKWLTIKSITKRRKRKYSADRIGLIGFYV